MLFPLLILLALLVTPATLSAQSIPLSGIITDSTSGDVLIGASVLLYSLPVEPDDKPVNGAVSNEYGFYSIPSVQPGRYHFVVESIGYDPVSEEFEISGTMRHDVVMQPSEEEGEVVTVTADRGPSTRAIGRTEITVEEVVRMPALGGESDVLRALQLTPSVQPSSEISSGLNVRGGSADQSLVLLDEVVIYNPSHIGGFLSTFNASALQKVELITGGIPAKFGGRLSSVLNLTSREGTKEKFSGNGGISMLSSQLTLEGPVNDDITFMVSGRRFYADLVTSLLTDSTSDFPDYHFYDLNGKIAWSATPTDRFYLSGYTGRDVLVAPREREYDINWGNSAANLRWARILSSDLFSNLSLSYTGYDFESRLRGEGSPEGGNEFVAATEIQDVRLKANLSWFPHNDHILQTGVEGVRHRFTTGTLGSGINPLDNNGRPESSETVAPSVITSFEAAAYLQDEWQVTESFGLNLGVRALWFEQGNYTFVEPRAAATLQVSDDLMLTASGGVAHQPVHLVIRNDLSLPTDTWFPATERVAPGRSVQGTLGVAGRIPGADLEIGVEGYYKDFANLYEFHDSVNFTSNLPFEEQLTQGVGSAYGIEFFLEKNVGDFTGWLSYTLSKTTRTFSDLNEGRPFSPRFDRRHSVKLVLFYQLGDSWDFGATWVVASGQPFTVPTGAYTLLPFDEVDEEVEDDFHRQQYQHSERNGFRLPLYHRLDVNFSHTFSLFELPFRASLNVYNLYNRQNVFSWFIRQDFGTNEPVATQMTLFPILPSFGLSFEF